METSIRLQSPYWEVPNQLFLLYELNWLQTLFCFEEVQIIRKLHFIEIIYTHTVKLMLNLLFGSAAVQFSIVFHNFIFQLFFLSVQMINFVSVTYQHKYCLTFSILKYFKINYSWIRMLVLQNAINASKHKLLTSIEIIFILTQTTFLPCGNAPCLEANVLKVRGIV